MNFSKTIIVGRLSMNPILKVYKKKDGMDGYRAFFRVAVTRDEDLGKPRAEQQADFYPVVCWGEAAKRHAQYLQTGTEVTIEGRIRVDQIKVEGKEPRENITLVARNIQYGQKSQKNRAQTAVAASPELVAQVAAALEHRQNAAAAGTPTAGQMADDTVNPYEAAVAG